MKIPPVKGTRDFYPEDMAVRNFLEQGWRQVSLRNGFEEYDGPIFEHLEMFTAKSGEEIVEQLFSLTDRGGRRLAIRPEITPTLARMVNQRINALPRPIKWFSIPRLCRAEKPQKGRLREFFQWNIDIIGESDVLADAEAIFTAVDYLQEVGLGPADVSIRISSRKMLAAVLVALGIDADQLEGLYTVLDKRAKVDDQAFEKMLAEKLPDTKKRQKVIDLMQVKDIGQISDVAELSSEASEAVAELKRLFVLLEAMGIADFCTFDIGIVRGLAYYTGIVFEIHDAGSRLRAIGGGGRYDNLLKLFGGPEVPATGFGIGDCVLAILLEEKGLLGRNVPAQTIDYYLACADQKYQREVLSVAARIRRVGFSAEFTYKTGSLGKQLKQASSKNARQAIIIGQEIEAGELAVKDMATGEQSNVAMETFFAELDRSRK
jgi:histidyl-tRNA synthetase